MSGVQDESTTVMNRRRGPRATRRNHASELLAPSASIALVVLLSGCTFGEDFEHYAIFDREAEPADAPPSELADQDLYDVDVDSLRFATEYEGDRLYLAKGNDPRGGICLLVDGPGDDGVPVRLQRRQLGQDGGPPRLPRAPR